MKDSIRSLLCMSLVLSAGCASGDVVNTALRRQPALAPAASLSMATGAFALLETAAGDAYVLGPEDVLTVDILDLKAVGETYSQEFKIATDGHIAVPLLGRIQAAGLTAAELRVYVSERLGENFLADPQVAVTILEHQSKRIAVLGAVVKPGVTSLQRNSATIVEALALAGGLSEAAGLKALLVRQGTPTEPARHYEIDLERLLAGDMSQNFVLFPGNVLQVVPADNYYVTGFVQKPGEFKLRRTISVMEAVAIAGGLVTPDASPDMARILRAGEPPIEIDLTAVASGEQEDVLIRNGDMVEVQQGFWRGFGLGLYRFVSGGIGFGVNLASFIP